MKLNGRSHREIEYIARDNHVVLGLLSRTSIRVRTARNVANVATSRVQCAEENFITEMNVLKIEVCKLHLSLRKLKAGKDATAVVL